MKNNNNNNNNSIRYKIITSIEFYRRQWPDAIHTVIDHTHEHFAIASKTIAMYFWQSQAVIQLSFLIN